LPLTGKGDDHEHSRRRGRAVSLSTERKGESFLHAELTRQKERKRGV